MRKKYKVVFCIDNYIKDGGASSALINYCRNNPFLESPVIFCRNLITNGRKLDEQVQKGSGKDIIDFYIEHSYDLIHWFKSDGDELFFQITDELKKRKVFIPIVTTMCQQPTFPFYQLSIREIEYSLVTVFIDKTAYDNRYYSFIPKKNKRMIYFGTKKDHFAFYEKMVKSYNPQKAEGEPIIYGRGSSLIKCPRDMFEVFDAIAPPKKFIIVGDGDRTWIEKEIAKRKNQYEIELIGNLPYLKWLEVESTFDVFLYYLPPDAYSSIDGTLGEAMLMSKPVVYCGPEAPKERFENGYNALVADHPSEIAPLCNKLADDPLLREKMGRMACETTKRDFKLETTISKYNELYRDVLDMSYKDFPQVPVFVRLKYFYDFVFIPQMNYKLFRLKQMLGFYNTKKFN